MTVRSWLRRVPGDRPFAGFHRGEQGDVLALPGWPWGVADRQSGWEGCPQACHCCCGSGCQHPAAGARRGVEMLGVEVGAVSVVILRNKSASVEKKGNPWMF